MADIACLSKFHFSRVFKRLCHETPYQYFYRTRLEYAARCLTYRPVSSISTLAMDCGFSDSAAFSNAFRQRFAVSPKLFRMDKKILNSTQDSASPHPYEFKEENLRVVEKPAMRLAYVRSFGPYSQTNVSISRSKSQIIEWARNQGLWSSNTNYVAMCPSNSVLTPSISCIHDASIQVPGDIKEDDVASIQTIPSGRYAVLRVPYAPIQNRAWNWLAFNWLPQSGEVYAMENSYEIWHGVATPSPTIELCMRLQ